MKINPLRKFSRTGDKKDKRGVALITVLAMVSLAAISVLSFFSLAITEQRSSEAFISGVRAQQVAEQAVNMVMSQIERGTYHGVGTTWASQPGAIRVWDTNSNQANKIYKLYSDEEMYTTTALSIADDFTEISQSDWTSKPHQYVDLNEPVIRGEKVFYPIADPAAAVLPDWPGKIGGSISENEGFG